jgi:hypothetical protein
MANFVAGIEADAGSSLEQTRKVLHALTMHFRQRKNKRRMRPDECTTARRSGEKPA